MTENAFSAELERLRPTLMRFAVLQLRDELSAQDVVQDTMLAALEGQSRFSGRSQLKTWVVAILRNKIVDRIMGNVMYRYLSAGAPAAKAASAPAETALASEAAAAARSSSRRSHCGLHDGPHRPPRRNPSARINL